MEHIKASREDLSKLSDEELRVNFNYDSVYTTEYKEVHPQTKQFVEKFGLSLRLFDGEIEKPIEKVAFGEKRTFHKFRIIKSSSMNTSQTEQSQSFREQEDFQSINT